MIVKNFLAIFLLALVLVSAPACQNAPAPGESKSFPLLDKQISMVAPPTPWVERVQRVGEGQADLGFEADTVVGVTYSLPEQKGLIAIGAINQTRELKTNEKGDPLTDKDGNPQFGDFIELSDDQETLNQIAMWVEKRDGERLKEEWITVLGTQAFHMVFEVSDGPKKQKGEQVHFTKDGNHYTLSILVPSEAYDSEVTHFRRMVESFKLSDKPEKTAAASE